MVIRDEFSFIDDSGTVGGLSEPTYSLVFSQDVFTVPTKLTSETGWSVPVTFDSYVTARIVNDTNGQTVAILSSSDLTFSKTNFDINDAISCNGEYSKRKKVRVSTTYLGKTLSKYMEFVLDFVKPATLELTFYSEKVYYLDDPVWYFFKPLINQSGDVVFNRLVVTTNTGDTLVDSTSRSEFAAVKFYEDSQLQHELSHLDQISKSSPKIIYATYELTNPVVYEDTKTYTLVYQYQLDVATDVISSLSFTELPISIKKGDTFESHKNEFALTATKESGATFVVTNYSFANNGYLFENFSSIEVVIDGVNYTVPLSSEFTLSSAVIKKVTPSVALKTIYELSENFNFSSLKFTVEFDGTDYTEEVSFWDGFTIEFGSLDEETDFDGSSASLGDLSLTEADSGTMTFSIESDIASEVFEYEVQINILELTNITSIKIDNIFSDYYVGDSFLKDGDTTTAIIYYKDSQQITRTKQIPLNGEYEKIKIEPQKGTLFTNTDVNRTITVTSVFDSSVNASYSISISPKITDNDTTIITLHASWASSVTYGGETIEPANGVLILLDQQGKMYGYIYNIYDENSRSKLVLFDDYVPEIEGAANIEIAYPSYKEGSSEEIDNCHFGCLFGANNAKNRLFLSGNRNIGNADWHSSEVNYTDTDGEVLQENGNFSYFSDMSIMYYGETDNDVVGYEVVSNDKLLVLKNKSDKEKTVYFRNPTVVKAIDSSGAEMTGIDGETLYQEEFSLTKGNNSVAGISPNSIANLNGDTLFLDSDKQLVGLDVAGIIGDNQRYANSRSKYIDKQLAKFDLSDSVVWTDNNYLFITVKDYGVLATHRKTFDSDSRQYEWFYLTSENPTAFLEKDDVIYFANGSGELYKYGNSFRDTKNSFSTYTLQYTSDGKLIVPNTMIETILATETTDDDGNKHYADFLFKSVVSNDSPYEDKVFYKVATMNCDAEEEPDILISAGYLEVLNEDVLPLLGDNRTFYLNYDPNSESIVIGNSMFWRESFGRQFKLESTTAEDLELDVLQVRGELFVLKYKNEDQWVKVPAVQYRQSAITSCMLCGCLEDSEVTVETFSTENNVNTLTLSIEGRKLDIVRYGEQPEARSFASVLICSKNVEAFYIAAPFVGGSLDYFKTIWSFTLTNDTGEPSQIDVAYASNKIPIVDLKKMSSISVTKEQLGYDLNDMSFSKVDFDKTVIPRTYTTNRVLARQKFICFAFKNYDDTNAILSSMSFTYTIPFPSYSGD